MTNFLTLAFLALIIVAMWVQDTAGKITISTFVVLAILWAIAWFAFIRKRVDGSLLEQMIPGDEDEESVELTDK